MNDADPTWQQFLKDHEGIEPLNFDSKGGNDFGGFDAWLDGIVEETGEVARLRKSLADNIVAWVDPNRERNKAGGEILKKTESDVLYLDAAQELDEGTHGNCAVILTHYGYNHATPQDSTGLAVLDIVAKWKKRPPVVAFASGDHAAENRKEFLRHGGWEYASSWQELTSVLDTLFHRR